MKDNCGQNYPSGEHYWFAHTGKTKMPMYKEEQLLHITGGGAGFISKFNIQEVFT